jgi:hypothetical protein
LRGPNVQSIAAAALLTAALLPASAIARMKLLRFPDVADDRVAFCFLGPGLPLRRLLAARAAARARGAGGARREEG